MKKTILFSLSAISIFAYINCTRCHNGGMAKKLNTLSKKEIIKKMKEYKNGKGNPTMVGIAQQMSDKEIEEVANKYGK